MPVHRPRICHRCRRPLRETQGYKKIEGRFTNYYCDEHVVLTTTGWRLLEPGEVPPPAVGSQEAAAADAFAGSIPWDDADKGPLEQPSPASPDDAYEATAAPSTFPGGVHVRTPAAAAAPIVEHLKELRQQPPADFNPLDDVGF